ncbi:MAG: site-specific integrase, partial [Clostridiales bacterium]|nr:site-specific integrase [Clostridiales bacterium]
MAKKNELYPKDTPQVIRDFLNYLSSVRGRSDATIKEYFLDLRTFFRFIKQYKGIVQDDVKFSNISINDIDIDFIRSITLSDMYEFMIFVKNERPTYHKSNNTTYGNNSSTRSRKTASIRSFYKYLVSRNLIETNI